MNSTNENQLSVFLKSFAIRLIFGFGGAWHIDNQGRIENYERRLLWEKR